MLRPRYETAVIGRVLTISSASVDTRLHSSIDIGDRSPSCTFGLNCGVGQDNF